MVQVRHSLRNNIQCHPERSEGSPSGSAETLTEANLSDVQPLTPTSSSLSPEDTPVSMPVFGLGSESVPAAARPARQAWPR
jgi:hypothetical protein